MELPLNPEERKRQEHIVLELQLAALFEQLAADHPQFAKKFKRLQRDAEIAAHNEKVYTTGRRILETSRTFVITGATEEDDVERDRR